MAKTCSVPPETPREKRKAWMARALALSYLAAVIVLGVYFVFRQDTHGTRITITKSIDSLDFTWKCKTCGTDNHIKEVVR